MNLLEPKTAAKRIRHSKAAVSKSSPGAREVEDLLGRLEHGVFSTKRIGDRWIRGGKSAVLVVPSVLAPGEHNYLLNPRHPDFAEITISKPRRFHFGPHLAS